MNDINKLILIYRSADGGLHEQPASDLAEVGTLIDPKTDEEMGLVGWREIK